MRNQGARGTCVAFASAAHLEFHRYGSAKTMHHSEQFLFWACKQIDGAPNEDGTHLNFAQRAMARRGVCLAKSWAYDPIPGATIDQGPPPAGAEAQEFRFDDYQEFNPKDVDAIRGHLDAGRPVVLRVRTYRSWDFPSVADTGEITMPLLMQPDGGHAVCVVGYELRPNVPGGGAFIFRNSWGRKWAKAQGRFGPGYGTLFFEYVRRDAVEAYA